LFLKNWKKSGQALPECLLRAAPQDNHRQAKILTNRTSWFAQSFCRLPHNQPFCCFFSVTLFAINPSFTVMFFQNHCFNPPTRSKKDAPEKKQLKAIIHNK
jgi:hypothetical protein